MARETAEPEVRALMLEIAADEWRHAELAWRCLRWILASSCRTQREGLDLHRFALARLNAATNSLATATTSGSDKPGHGVSTLPRAGHCTQKRSSVFCARALARSPGESRRTRANAWPDRATLDSRMWLEKPTDAASEWTAKEARV